MRAMRWNLIWFLPIVAAMLAVAAFDALEAYVGFRVIVAHMRWRVLALLFSPAADLWLGAVFASIWLPFQALILIPCFFDPSSEDLTDHPYRNSTICFCGALALVYVTWFVMWGTFPLDNSPEGVRIRLIPFFPWPNHSFFSTVWR